MTHDSAPRFAFLSTNAARRGLLWSSLAAALAWALWLAWAGSRGTRATDGVRTWSDAGAAGARAAVWGEPEELALPLPPGRRLLSAAPSPDGAWLALALADEQGSGDLYLAPLDPVSGFVRDTPRALTALNTSAHEEAPAWTKAGLCFASNRAGGAGGLDLWQARKGRASWEDVHALAALNSPFDDTDPAPSYDGGECVFASNRPREPEGVAADYDLWYARSLTQPDACLRLDALSTAADERDVVLGGDARSLWFASARGGDYELYRARYAAGAWSEAEHVRALGSAAAERGPRPQRGGFALCYTQHADGAAERWMRAESIELWQVPRGVTWFDLAVLASLLACSLLAWLGRRGGAFDTLYRWGVVSIAAHLALLWWLQFVVLEGRELAPAPADDAIEIRLLDEPAFEIEPPSEPDAATDAATDATMAAADSAAPAPLARPEPTSTDALAAAAAVADTPIEAALEPLPTQRRPAASGEAQNPRTASAESSAAAAPLALLTPTAVAEEDPRPSASASAARARGTSSAADAALLRDVASALPRPQRGVDEPAEAWLATPSLAPLAARAAASALATAAPLDRHAAPAEDLDAPELALEAPTVAGLEAPTAAHRDANSRRMSLDTPAFELRDEPPAHGLALERPSSGADAGAGSADGTNDAGEANAGAAAPTTTTRPQRPGGTTLVRRESGLARLEQAPAPALLAPSTEPAAAANSAPARASGSFAQRAPSVGAATADAQPPAGGLAALARPAAPSSAARGGPASDAAELAAAAPRHAARAAASAAASGGDDSQQDITSQRLAGSASGAQPALLPPALPSLAVASSDSTARLPRRGGGAATTRASSLEPDASRGALLDAPQAGPLRPAALDAATNLGSGGDALDAAARPERGLGRERVASAAPSGPRSAEPSHSAGAAPSAPGLALPDASPPRAASIERPTSDRLAATPYRTRFGDAKRTALAEGGGNARTEQAVERGLAYLASVQRPSGLWGAGGELDAKYGDIRVGKTGLCLLAYLGAGHTPQSNTAHSAVVTRALDALLALQDEASGQFGDTEAYGHGIATYALAETYALTQDARLEASLSRAVARILAAQQHAEDPALDGGWSYYYADTERRYDRWPRAAITAWQVMALESARLGGIAVPDAAFESATAFMRGTFDAAGGYFRYNHDPARTSSAWPTLPASTPAALFTLSLGGQSLDAPQLDGAWQYVLARAPRRYAWEGEDAFVQRGAGNVYYWYYATLACFRRGGDTWQRWNVALQQTLLPAQARDGSWQPIDPYAEYARDDASDKSYTTATCVLCLEVYYRYFTPLLKLR
jgi:hypothetical protein